jgi:HSP20 family protein
MRVRTYNDLLRDFATWADAMNRTFGPYDYTANGGSNDETTSQPITPQAVRLPLDVWTTPEAFHLRAYVPGVNPEDVEITIEKDELTIRGALPAAEEGATWLKRELFHGSFERRLSFNVPVNVDAIEAHFSNGLLTLTVPKAEAVRPKQIKVQVK